MPTPSPRFEFDDALYQKLRGICARVARGLDIEDLTQAVAVRIVRARLLDKWCAERGSFEAYLFVVARSEALSLRRTQRRKAARHEEWRASVMTSLTEQHREQIRALVSSCDGSGFRELARRVSPSAARLLWALLEGRTGLDVRQEIGHRAYGRAFRQLTEVARAVAR